ncbi:MAG: hypothetical protein AAB209_11345, partial [Bacteroidota bacterium]
MLNYIWLALIAIGILVAIGNDVYDERTNAYRNGVPFTTAIELQNAFDPNASAMDGQLVFSVEQFNSF